MTTQELVDGTGGSKPATLRQEWPWMFLTTIKMHSCIDDSQAPKVKQFLIVARMLSTGDTDQTVTLRPRSRIVFSDTGPVVIQIPSHERTFHNALTDS